MHKKVWQLAGPIMLANLTVPLLGAVDIAVMGHLTDPANISAVGIGATIFSALYFGFVFLRMGTTGLVAIAHGKDDEIEKTSWLIRSLVIAVIIGVILLLANQLIAKFSFFIIKPPQIASQLAESYFAIRIMSAPAALANFAILGWLIGLQKTTTALYIQLILNITNIILDLYFVMVLNLGVSGVASATVIAEYVGLCCGLLVALPYLKRYMPHAQKSLLFNGNKLNELFALNFNIFIRSLCLQIAFFYFTAMGSTFGNTILAANVVLMNFQYFLSYALDGFANAAEALTGEAIGKKQIQYFYRTVKTTAFWAIVFALLFSMIYILFWEPIVFLLTDINEVVATATQYIPWVILLPLLSVWSFHLDGIFIGATITKPMRNSMVLSLAIFILCSSAVIPLWGNHGLWFAFCVFMIARAVSLGWAWPQLLIKFN